MPGMDRVKEFEYSFKIRDKTNADAWMDETGLIPIPPKDELPTTPINQVAEGVKSFAEKLGFGKKE